MVVGIVLAAALVAGSAAAQQSTPCDAEFPEQAWELVSDEAGVAAYQAGMRVAEAERYARTARQVATWVGEDFGSFPGATLCVYAAEVELEPSRLVEAGHHPRGQRIHAVRYLDTKLIYIDAQQPQLVEDAVALGIAHIAMWHEGGGEGYPEPLAGAISQWYVARRNGKLPVHHTNMRLALFFNNPRNEQAAFDWFLGEQEPTVAWNPQFQESPIGDFIDFAVKTNGPEILRSPTPAEWTAAEEGWRQALREELLEGRGETRGWMGGVAIAVGVVLAALGMAIWGRIRNKRKQKPIGEIAVVEGFFDRSDRG